MTWSAAHLKRIGVVLQALAGWHRLMNAAVGGAALLSVLLSVANPAQADPFFQSNKPPLQEMKVSSNSAYWPIMRICAQYAANGHGQLSWCLRHLS